MSFEIVKPDPSMLSAMVEIETRAHPYPWRESQLASCFGDRYINGLLLVNQVPAGFYIADQIIDESTLMNICVLPEYRRQRLGQQLMAHYLTETLNAGCSHWFLEVRASNLAAQRLYEQSGYTQNGIRKGYYHTDDGREDAILMSKVTMVESS